MTNLSLKQKFVLMTLSLLLITGGINSNQFAKSVNTLKTSDEARVQRHADQLGKAIGAQFYERYGDAQAFAVNAIFEKGRAEEMVAALDHYAKLYGIYTLIMYLDTNGRLVAANSQDPRGKRLELKELYATDFSREKWFRDALEGHFLQDLDKNYDGTVFEDVQRDRWTSIATGESSFGSSFSAPVRDAAGKVIGVLSNRADLKWLQGPLAELYAQLSSQGFRNTQIEIFNAAGWRLTGLTGADGGQVAFQAPDETVSASLPAEIEGHFTRPAGQAGAKEVVGHATVTGPKFIEALGWRTMIRIPENELHGGLLKEKSRFLGILATLVFLSCLVAVGFASRVSRTLKKIAGELHKVSGGTTRLSRELGSSATVLANSNVEQTSALQESVASLAEMSAMISRTAQSVRMGLAAAHRSKENASTGIVTMQEMKESIAAILSSSADLQQISRVIDDMSAQTQLIHDIVFKTQLLSFNASIEAARAGPHGRGFSVVAQEMGKLAQKSGSAAHQIESLLEKSKGSVSQTLAAVSEQVKIGAGVGEKLESAFNTIGTQTEDLETQIRAVNEATDQQERGIHQLNFAIKKLDETFRDSAQISQNTMTASQELDTSVNRFDDIASELNQLLGADHGERSEVMRSESSLRERFLSPDSEEEKKAA